MTSTITTIQTPLTAKQVASMLGVSDQTIRRRALEGLLKGVRVGPGKTADWRFSRDAVNDFIEMHTQNGQKPKPQRRRRRRRH